MDKKRDTTQNVQINRDDIPFYEKLGIRPRKAHSFYAKDLVSFFKDQIKGESDKKVQEIQKNLYLVIEFIENERLTTWTAFDYEVWKKLMLFSFLDLSYEQNSKQVEAFYSLMQNFAEWLEEHQQASHYTHWVMELETQYNLQVLQAVHVMQTYSEQIENPFLTGYGEIRRESLFQEEDHKSLVQGVFEVEAKMGKTLELISLMTQDRLNLNVAAEVEHDFHVGTTMIGILKKVEQGKWEIHTLDRVFPPDAKFYLYKAIGLNT